jgi:Methyltransferase domain
MKRVTATSKLRNAVLFDETQQPWRSHPGSSSYHNPVLGMMAPDEFAFLRWAAETQIDPGDKVVDMGPLAGGSTLALARGIMHNPNVRTGKLVHSYDLWRFNAVYSPFFPGHQLKDDDDTFPLFWENVKECHDLIVPHCGDIGEMAWDGDPIGILFVDAAKTPSVMAHIVNAFLPSLRPGGILIQQDYVSSQHPWIHIAQELLMDHFEIADSPFGGSVCFRLVTSLEGRFLPPTFFGEMETQQARELLRRAAAKIAGWHGLCVQLSEAHFCLWIGDFASAEFILDRVVADPDYCNFVAADVEVIKSCLTGRSRLNPHIERRKNAEKY